MIKNKLFLFFGGVILLLVVSISAIWLGGCAKVLEAVATQEAAAPKVISVSPARGAADIFLNIKAVSATFDNDMDSASAALSLSSAQGAVTGTVTCSAKTIKFVPANDLAANVTYTASVPATVKSTAGKALGTAYSWTFTTGTQSDTTAPTITAVSPADQAANAAVNTVVTATFDKGMDPSTLTSAVFTLTSAVQAVTGTVSYDATNKKAVFSPSLPLANNITYTATVSAGAKDIYGNALAAGATWSFTTVAAAGGGGTADCSTVILPEVPGTGGMACRISLVSPLNCQEVSFPVLIEWTTSGTYCETPYKFYITDDPTLSRYYVRNFSEDVSSGITKTGGGYFYLQASELAKYGIATTGTLYWVVTNYYDAHPANRAFVVK